jgi:hypothetical protein
LKTASLRAMAADAKPSDAPNTDSNV